MASGLLRTTFNRSGLVRILSETIPDAIDPTYDFGERLGQWLSFTDALALFSVLNPTAGSAPPVEGNTDSTVKPLLDQLARVRQNLSESILNDGVFSGEAPRLEFPTPLPHATPESASDFLPYHRYYLAHQRDMSAAISALRANARNALSKRSPSHRQLAELDVSFENALAERQRNLLVMIPMLLAKRFTQRYQDHRDALADSACDDPATWTRSGSWLEAFCRDTQAVLLAELDLRLKPVAGLIAALETEGDQTK